MIARFLLIPAFVANRKLHNYLRTYRKRTGFFQDELAFLLGTEGGGPAISRYEHFVREPTLQTALACEVILRVPVRELFAGMYEEAERKTLERVRLLSEKLNSSDPPAPQYQRQRNKVEGVLLALLADLQEKYE
jgi:transcriptional regulator with XRE-family HTH domain